MYPAATLMYMQSLPRPEPNYVSKSRGPITNPHTDTNGNPLPISKKKKKTPKKSFRLLFFKPEPLQPN